MERIISEVFQKYYIKIFSVTKHTHTFFKNFTKTLSMLSSSLYHVVKMGKN